MKNILIFLFTFLYMGIDVPLVSSAPSLNCKNDEELSCLIRDVRTKNYKGYILDSIFLVTNEGFHLNGNINYRTPTFEEIALTECYLNSIITRDFLESKNINPNRAFPNSTYRRIYKCSVNEHGDRILDIKLVSKRMMYELLVDFRRCLFADFVDGDYIYITFNVTKKYIVTFVDRGMNVDLR